ncbi:SDR family oxidoreductase [Paenibacillus lupini]|uniref:SDR family oxidoreductase n=1 Tax=Paenibacillus lupini TaxID=1450204 RepID=UPI00141EB101|nr:SDR family oxidoreductase [Paenibacillus lupini]
MGHKLKGRVAIVTGASRKRGIGTAICRALALEGADILFTHWGSFDKTQIYGEDSGWENQLSKELEELGVRVAHLEVDLADPLAANEILDYAEKTLGTPSILVNNATYWAESNYLTLDAEVFDRHYAVNIRGTSLLSTTFAQRFEQAHAGSIPGRIIFMVSKGNDANNLAYLATKGAQTALIEPLSVGLAPLGITVNAVDPGPTDSGWMDEDVKSYLLPMFPMGRIGQPEDAARLITFLVSDEAGWVTGQRIVSEGGFINK